MFVVQRAVPNFTHALLAPEAFLGQVDQHARVRVAQNANSHDNKENGSWRTGQSSAHTVKNNRRNQKSRGGPANVESD